MTDPILHDLNPAQHAAVAHGTGPLMVLAGAGSGKTRVVTRRIARLIRDGEAQPWEILALTFTNKAAGEMARRVQELGGDFVRVSTFHSACARFMRQDGERLGYPRDFSIYDTYDRDSLIKMLMQERNLSITTVRPNHVGRLISKLKNLQIRPDEGIPGSSEVNLVAAEIYPAYEARMRKLGALDFDDLMLRFLDLLREEPDLAETYRERFPWLLVDEFQDTNRVQYDLLQSLSKTDGNLCVVGDPDQSIYGFRGADIRNILDFEQDYPATKVVRLEQNYRSTKTILEAAETVIANNTQRKEKHLFSEGDQGDPILLHRAEGPGREAEEIVQQIAGKQKEGLPLDQVSIFYRAHYLSRFLEEALKERGIPYEIVGGLSFFERREIKDLIAYLRVLVNPLDDVSMQRVINVPPRGIGKTSLGKLTAKAAAEQVSLFELILDSDMHDVVAGKARKGIAELHRMYTEAKVQFRRGARYALETVLEGTNYLGWACQLGDPEDVSRKENIEELVSNVVHFDETVGEGLSGYLQHVSLLTSQDLANEGPRVTMMTVHAAKGLEFDHVFVAGLEEGVFPSSRAQFDNDAVEEERRLMYVAVTRARKTLWLSSSRERMVNGSMMDNAVSRFVGEIPKTCIERFDAWNKWENWDAEEGVEETPDADWEGAVDVSEPVELQVGMRVAHPLYGAGQVRVVSGRGISMKATVRFDDGAEKNLLLEYAGLRLLGMSAEDSW